MEALDESVGEAEGTGVEANSTKKKRGQSLRYHLSTKDCEFGGCTAHLYASLFV
jgi:hypothetical protein